MKILTISIDGQSRAELLRALVDVMEEIHRGTDSASYMNEKLSMSFNIREYDLPGEVPTASRGQVIDITPKIVGDAPHRISPKPDGARLG